MRTGLDGYWRLDEGAGAVAFDETANANDGTLTNMDAATDWVLADHAPYQIVAYGTTPHVGVLPGADADGDALTYGIVTNGTGGTATVTDAATGAFTYVPTANANGTDSFVYRISDGANTADETVSVTLKSAPFTDVATAAGVASGSNGYSRGAAWADYDGDGDLDVYVGNSNATANLLFQNDGTGSFSNVASGAGVANTCVAFSPAWGDYNGDGHPDLFVGNNINSVLYSNDGDGTFTNATSAAGVSSTSARGAAWGDYDGDGDLDLYVAHSSAANKLFENNGAGTFTNVATAAAVASADSSLGVSWADYDGDGDLDLYVSNTPYKANILYRNDGGTFVVTGEAAGGW